MPQAQRRPDGDGDGYDEHVEALERASGHLIEARREADRAQAPSLRMFVNMALIEAANLLARFGGRGRDGR
ncbi:hypothetical protein [Bosea beijingensis]|uniref:hypothetical protein n=1 Tax=Bosea beijingensis TaxID=3068632 RepID=UPI002740BE30|nr:hypothetical protein [Bosea sp. REN20]